jgi:hypothetical protein
MSSKHSNTEARPFITKGTAWPWDALMTVPDGWVRLDKTRQMSHRTIAIFATEDHDHAPKMVDTNYRAVSANENGEKDKL